MAVTRRTLRLADQLRIVLDRTVDATVRELVEAWARAWQVIDREWIAAMDELVDLGSTGNDGQWPTPGQMFRARATQAALESATREIAGLAEFAGVTVVTAAREVTEQVAEWQERIADSQLPNRHGLAFQPMPDQVLAAMVERTTEQIEARTRPLEAHAVEAMRQALIRGVVIGENPRATARQMVKRAEYRFNGGLTRAMVLARTEILDAHRSAAAAWQFEQTAVLRGWVWNAKLDARTCPSCWAKHGTEHELSEVGPNDHQQGRCARTPLTRSWADLGFDDVEEPPSLLPDAREVFDQLTAAEQQRVMGAVRLKALRSGAMSWEDLTQLRVTPGWRDSWVPATVGDARRALLTSV